MSPDSPATAEQIFRENYATAIWIAWRITGNFCDAQEVVQDAGLELSKKEERGEKVSRPLFFGIVRNKAHDAWRARKRQEKLGVPESDFDGPDDGKVVPFLSKLLDKKTPQPDESARRHAQGALLDTMHQWLRKVYPDGAEVFQIHILEDHSQAQTAKILGVTEETVKQRWKKARTLLRTRFRKAYDELFN